MKGTSKKDKISLSFLNKDIMNQDSVPSIQSSYQSEIIAIGGAVPSRKIHNSELEHLLDTTDEWIQQRTGIQTRHWVYPSESTSDIASLAAESALESGQVDKKDIEALIVATSTPDFDIPGTATILQKKLGFNQIPAFEIRQACSGFLFALAMADSFIKSGLYKKILVVGAEVQSKVLDLTPRGKNVSIIFADGGGAVVVGRSSNSQSRIHSINLYSDGSYAPELCIKAPGSSLGPERLNEEALRTGNHFLHMNGKFVFTHAVTKMPQSLLEACEKSQIKMESIDHFFFHQANLRINEKIAADLNIPSSKIHNTIQKWGNTTAATLPMALWDAQNNRHLKKGQKLALTAFGAGFSWGSIILTY